MPNATHPSHSTERASREVEAYAEGGFLDERSKHQSKLRHYYSTPSNSRLQQAFKDVIEANLSNTVVLEIGCGIGWNCQQMLDHGAAEVHGIDIAESKIGQALAKFDDPRLTFSLHDIHEPLDGKYDLIIGRAVLHHVDYQSVLQQLYDNNLNPGGKMFFIEPMAEGLLTKLYWKLTPHMHTPDERPFYAHDIAWLKDRFPSFRLIPFGYLAFPVNIVSAAIMPKPGNALTQFADSIDQRLAKLEWLGPRFHTGIFCIQKPAADARSAD
ncbi:MAG: methyltransferase domain-containing protein [Alphaproteobacteria bacterium]|nr:methyltransferase domain-containing protein [Alphaproteobacteria bacterium]MCB9930725.1 methyltransferase domain-containing protein [Alphaproteobacteria bacterium]